jgi:hypothetical protein
VSPSCGATTGFGKKKSLKTFWDALRDATKNALSKYIRCSKVSLLF